MDKLWAPWRIKYVSKIGKNEKGCLFCRIIKQNRDRKNLIFKKTKHSFAVLNLYPYNNGHVLVVPRRHVGKLKQLTNEELLDVQKLLIETQEILNKVLQPQGYNIGVNIGRVAGAGIPGHVHWHVVPRWRGDVNFMPVTTQTKVISQSLQTLYGLLIRQSKRL